MFKRLWVNSLMMLVGIVVAVFLLETFLHLFPEMLPLPVQIVAGFLGEEGARRTAISDFARIIYDLREEDDYLGYKYLPDLNVTLKHPEYEYILKTTSLGFDHIGFRDDGINGISGAPYAVAVGDSFTEGMGVGMSETWVELLENRSGRDIVNMGISGYSSPQLVRMLTKYGMRLKPKLVLYVFNYTDLIDSAVWQARLEHSELEPHSSQAENAGIAALKEFLHEHSVVYELLQYLFGMGTYSEHAQPFATVRYNDAHLSLVFFTKTRWMELLKPDSFEKYRRDWEVTQEAILESNAVARSKGATLVVIITPMKEQIYWDYLKPHLADHQQYDVNQPNRLVADFCELHNIHYLDLTPVLTQKAQRNEQLYFPTDAHWTEKGHEVITDMVFEYLHTHDLLSL